METKYLQEDCPSWNIVKGFDGFMERFPLFNPLTIDHREQAVAPRFLARIEFSHSLPTVLLLQEHPPMIAFVSRCSYGGKFASSVLGKRLSFCLNGMTY